MNNIPFNSIKEVLKHCLDGDEFERLKKKKYHSNVFTGLHVASHCSLLLSTFMTLNVTHQREANLFTGDGKGASLVILTVYP